MADKTEWKPVPQYEGLYEVNNLGDVRSVSHVVNFVWGTRYTKPKLLRQVANKKTGYMSVCLCKGNKKKMVLVHRIVAMAFLENENDFPQVNHKDENKRNNSADNLEWCTAKYNNNYGTVKSRISKKNKIAKCKPVAQLINGKIIRVFPSAISASDIADPCHIGKCCNGKRKSAGGYQWAFVNGG